MTEQTEEALKMAVEEMFKAGMILAEALQACKETLALSEKQHTFPDKKQPAQEPVGYTEPADLESVPQGDTGLWFAKKDERYSVPLYTHHAPSWQVSEEMKLILGLEFLKWNRGNSIANSGDAYVKIAYEQHVFNKVVEIITKSNPAPSWQGNKEFVRLSDDEKLAIIRKWKDAHTMRAQELIGLGDAFEQALKEKNT